MKLFREIDGRFISRMNGDGYWFSEAWLQTTYLHRFGFIKWLGCEYYQSAFDEV